ncbi:MAG: anti-anti-sigma factor [Candidatus Yanofskybacteria bacterium CG10_big_fil_rev_8_21_14_0_10_46_23]|uniref:Anti-anti-sigma factor n=1 Tax=Candidatus Yanofskybacteria bacterium CG10_big_fil_rev_8_21_14_0_10_46_23 TaxID=1975098 RepID=A0A2H0R4S9_9BACT|nr:MAG: anti-anti-sigma factor [Candidatus Yanofskybacteria bacterium CG10_big_fil_rev_8_21_14_0_10_46_23]
MENRSSVTMHGDVAVFHLDKRITISEGGSTKFKNRVLNLLINKKKKILLDMSRVECVDSGGIGEFVRAFVTTTNNGGQIKIYAMSREKVDSLTFTKLAMTFDTFEGLDDALASLN